MLKVRTAGALVMLLSMLPAQVVIDEGVEPPGKDEVKPPPDPKRIPALVAALKDDRGWWDAARELGRYSGGEHEAPVFEALGELWRSTEDPVIHERFYVAFGRLAQPSHIKARRARTEELIDDVKNFLDKAAKALDEAKSPDAAAAAARHAKTAAVKLEQLRREMKELDDEDLRRASGERKTITISTGGDGPDEPAPEEDPAPAPPEADPPAPPPGGGRDGDASPGAAAAAPGAPDRAGDPRRIRWIRPVAAAVEEAKAAGRVLLVKPILGGSNTPDPDGVPCGGTRDCEGSW